MCQVQCELPEGRRSCDPDPSLFLFSFTCNNSGVMPSSVCLAETHLSDISQVCSASLKPRANQCAASNHSRSCDSGTGLTAFLYERRVERLQAELTSSTQKKKEDIMSQT